MIAAGVVLMWLVVLLGIVGLVAWRTGAWRDCIAAKEVEEPDPATTQPAAWADTPPPKEPTP